MQLLTARNEVPLALSKQEASCVTISMDDINGLKINIGILQYSIEDLMLYQIAGKRSFLATSLSTTLPVNSLIMTQGKKKEKRAQRSMSELDSTAEAKTPMDQISQTMSSHSTSTMSISTVIDPPLPASLP